MTLEEYIELQESLAKKFNDIYENSLVNRSMKTDELALYAYKSQGIASYNIDNPLSAALIRNKELLSLSIPNNVASYVEQQLNIYQSMLSYNLDLSTHINSLCAVKLGDIVDTLYSSLNNISLADVIADKELDMLSKIKKNVSSHPHKPLNVKYILELIYVILSLYLIIFNNLSSEQRSLINNNINIKINITINKQANDQIDESYIAEQMLESLATCIQPLKNLKK